MSPSSTTPATSLPAKVQQAFDAAVLLHRSLADLFRMPRSKSRDSLQRDAINKLTAANRVLRAHDPQLVQAAGRAAEAVSNR